MENSELKQILYVAPEEQTISYRWENKVNQLDPNITVVSPGYLDALQNRSIVFMTTNNTPLTEGMILGKHPYKPGHYMDMKMAEDILISEKLNCMAEVAKLLGVKEFKAEANFLEEMERELNIAGKIGFKAMGASGSMKEAAQEHYAKKYRRSEKYTGQFSSESYKKALQMIKANGLESNSDLMFLIRQRNPDDENTLTEQSIQIELTEECNSLTEIAFSLNIMPSFSMKAGYQETISKQKKIVLETTLKFS